MSLGVIIDPGHHPRRFTPANHTLARTSTHSWHTREIKPHRNTYRFSLFSFPFSLSLSLLLFQISPPRVFLLVLLVLLGLTPRRTPAGKGARSRQESKDAHSPALPRSLTLGRPVGLSYSGACAVAAASFPSRCTFLYVDIFFFPS